MAWFYATGDQPQGPVSEADLDALVKAGAIRPETLVWREGMADWEPFRKVSPSSILPPIVAQPAAFDDQRRALHDHICDTRVVKKVCR